MEGIEVHANEGGLTRTRGGAYWLILPAGCNTLPNAFIELHVILCFLFNDQSGNS